jgi:adenylate cyclase
VGTRNARLFPESTRALGARVHEGREEVTVFVPAATGGTTVANLVDNGRIAVCFSRPRDHCTLQLEGALIELREADAGDRAVVERYRTALVECLGWIGIPPRLVLRLVALPRGALPDRIGLHADAGPGRRRAAGHARQRTTPVNERPPIPPRCFDGVAPAVIATCGLDGEPNFTYLSQVHYVAPDHVALSCHFLNKTRRNVEESPYAAIVLHDPLTSEAYRMRLQFDHAEMEGPLFDSMAARIQVIASHTGMAAIFRLIAADVYRVLSVEPVEGFLVPPDPVIDAGPTLLPGGPLTELRGLQIVSDRIARAHDMNGLLSEALAALDELLGFSHAMILLAGGGRLVCTANRGYGDKEDKENKPAKGIGIEVPFGAGLIGTVAQLRRMVRLSGMGSELRYGRAIRGRAEELGHAGEICPEVPLPGLENAQAQLALPLLAGETLVGVPAVERSDPLCFDEWDEAFLQIVANQISAAIDRVRATPATPAPAPAVPVRRFTFYKNDDCLFVEREYLVRNVPGRIFWKLLNVHAREGRTEFTNRELHLDPSLGLPPIKDNLESRLILLRKRLAEKCPEARLVPQGRGRFALQLACVPELHRRETGWADARMQPVAVRGTAVRLAQSHVCIGASIRRGYGSGLVRVPFFAGRR